MRIGQWEGGLLAVSQQGHVATSSNGGRDVVIFDSSSCEAQRIRRIHGAPIVGMAWAATSNSEPEVLAVAQADCQVEFYRNDVALASRKFVTTECRECLLSLIRLRSAAPIAKGPRTSLIAICVLRGSSNCRQRCRSAFGAAPSDEEFYFVAHATFPLLLAGDATSDLVALNASVKPRDVAMVSADSLPQPLLFKSQLPDEWETRQDDQGPHVVLLVASDESAAFSSWRLPAEFVDNTAVRLRTSAASTLRTAIGRFGLFWRGHPLQESAAGRLVGAFDDPGRRGVSLCVSEPYVVMNDAAARVLVMDLCGQPLRLWKGLRAANAAVLNNKYVVCVDRTQRKLMRWPLLALKPGAEAVVLIKNCLDAVLASNPDGRVFAGVDTAEDGAFVVEIQDTQQEEDIVN